MTTSVLLTTIGAAMMATLAIIIRLKATKKPASIKKIVLPPLFMSTGFLMFLYEPTRPAPLQVLEALSVGMLFSILLIKTSKFEIKDQEIYLKRSKAFVFILVGLLIARILFKIIIGDSINVEELSGMFFLLAYGMIIPWRIAMYLSFRKVEQELKNSSKETLVPAET
ncbi:CcdC family protein [Alkalihalobacterium chitinilyticum]|uniref:Cytochrome c biogenesis protein CcdC n=1 Tax=Alkalihalobacterium chitinilyticum TaxID=2980103 RepID=A0ABT5VBM7_9BACI|nr:cytochrome c biogenesis protein CcdC [Alkalihalobacterium chitinilyticum]MDE5412855.1 cytochrome c biogenesis protein CcdC [Alkalihalobacterium chitinilyticum]